ncbi:MAG: hypothetical protein LBH48_03520, partial [Bifidobacteriaceae bacterium]|nr:hypothetical protein [Bifidobacteriaceae bacterium]
MTFVLIGLAVVAAALTWAAAAGAFTLSFADPIAKQNVDRAKRRHRTTRQVLTVLSGVHPSPTPAEPLFPAGNTEED